MIVMYVMSVCSIRSACMYMRVSMRVCMCVHMHACMSACAYVYVCVC